MNQVCLILCFRYIMTSNLSTPARILSSGLPNSLPTGKEHAGHRIQGPHPPSSFVSPFKLLNIHSSFKSHMLGTLLLQDKSSQYSDKSGFWTWVWRKVKRQEENMYQVCLWIGNLVLGLFYGVGGGDGKVGKGNDRVK